MRINEGKTYKEYYEAEYGKKEKKVISWSKVTKELKDKDETILAKRKWNKSRTL